MTLSSSSQHEGSTVHISGALARYVAAAALARSADGGAVVGVVLLATSSGEGGRVAGLLGACITAPHMLGPFLARRIDLASDGRKVIFSACILYAFAFGAGVLTFGHVALWLTGVLFALTGCCGPFLTGGISSRLPSIVAKDQKSQRRAQAWDVATYGIGGTIGPSIVAAISAWWAPAEAALCLATASLIAAILVMRLPYAKPEHGGDPLAVPSVWATIKIMTRDGRLRRTLYMTMLVAFSMAALPITAVHMTSELHVQAANAAVLTAAYGIGNLSGSVAVMLRPLSGSPDLLMTRLSGLILIGLIAVLSSFNLVMAACAYWMAGALNALFFASTLAARSEYAPTKARGQVFLWVAALKITSGSAGTATAGVLTGVQISVPLLAGMAIISIGAMSSIIERGIEARKVLNPS